MASIASLRLMFRAWLDFGTLMWRKRVDNFASSNAESVEWLPAPVVGMLKLNLLWSQKVKLFGSTTAGFSHRDDNGKHKSE